MIPALRARSCTQFELTKKARGKKEIYRCRCVRVADIVGVGRKGGKGKGEGEGINSGGDRAHKDYRRRAFLSRENIIGGCIGRNSESWEALISEERSSLSSYVRCILYSLRLIIEHREVILEKVFTHIPEIGGVAQDGTGTGYDIVSATRDKS